MKSEPRTTAGAGGALTGEASAAQALERTDSPPDRLTNCVNEFCKGLLATFAPRVERQAKGFRRRVSASIAKRLPPFRKPSGRPKLRRVTLAAAAYECQRKEIEPGHRKCIDWLRIARDCDPTFDVIRCDYRRRIVLKRLRDAVHARLHSGAPD